MSLEPGLRVIPQLRAAHLQEIDALAPRRLLYFDLNYDMRGVEIPAHAECVSLHQAIRAVAAQPDGVLELFEPLWVEYLVPWLVLATIWRLTRRGRPRSPKVAFYAIENNEALSVLDRGRSWLTPAARVALGVLRALVPRLTFRCAFGTQEAAGVYAGLTPASVETKVIWDLPTPRELRTLTGAPTPTAVFVGALESRKGIEPLLAAWVGVEDRSPDARLTIVGDGPLRDIVAAWTQESPRSRAWLGRQDRREIMNVLARSTALAAPSMRTGRWREQVGRPILEALSCGLTVVTSSETGLSAFLRAHGHEVIADVTWPPDLQRALCQALEHPLPREAVLAALPAESGRITADRWLHRSWRV